jgi:hypothetical protein
LVYELARSTLKKHISRNDPGLNNREAQECILALETAIARVEEDSARAERLATDPMLLSASPTELPDTNSVSRAVMTSPSDDLSLEAKSHVPLPAELQSTRTQVPATEIVYPDSGSSRLAQMQRRAWLWFILWPAIQLMGLVVLVLVLYMAMSGRLGLGPAPVNQAVDQESFKQVLLEKARVQSANPPSSGLPLPSSYGIYALSDKHLIELEPLPIRAPDVRVRLSAEITKPSSVRLPDGKLTFVVFRRDLVNSAPQKVTVRVIARVTRAVTLSSGKAVASDIEGSWRIRNNSYDYRVAPLSENREMVAIRPETPDFTLPAGRYALVLGGLAYDFTVDGQITAAEQCLESFEAVNGLVFNECRAK